MCGAFAPRCVGTDALNLPTCYLFFQVRRSLRRSDCVWKTMHLQSASADNVLLLLLLSGAKKREEIYTAFENIYPTLKEYKKKEAADAAGLGPLAAKPSGKTARRMKGTAAG